MSNAYSTLITIKHYQIRLAIQSDTLAPAYFMDSPASRQRLTLITPLLISVTSFSRRLRRRTRLPAQRCMHSSMPHFMALFPQYTNITRQCTVFTPLHSLAVHSSQCSPFLNTLALPSPAPSPPTIQSSIRRSDCFCSDQSRARDAAIIRTKQLLGYHSAKHNNFPLSTNGRSVIS